jgi:hypothetical protein
MGQFFFGQMSRKFFEKRAFTQEYVFVYAYPLVCHLIRMRRRIMSTEMYGMPTNIDVDYNMVNPTDERIHGGFGHGGFGHGGFGHGGFGHGGFGHGGFGHGGFGRPGFGFGRPGFGFGGFGRPGFGFGFGLPFLGGLAAGALLSPGYGYGYPYYPPYPYPYPYYPWY